MASRFFYCILFMLSFSSLLLGQEQDLVFKNTPLDEVLRTIESKTDHTFNYNPTQLQRYQYSGVVRLNKKLQFIAKLLSDTPFAFEQSGTSILVFPAEKKQYRICGKLWDGSTNLPLSYANIYTNDQLKGGQSDTEGNFDFQVEAYPHTTINISFVGYTALSTPIVNFKTNGCLDFVLKPDPTTFSNTIVVTDYILDGIKEGKSNSGVSLSYQQLDNWYTNIEQDVLKTIQLIPGITSTDESVSNIQIRGATADQNLVLWEGANIYDSGHLFGAISAINPFVIDEVNVFKGVFDPSYTNRVGGIIDISLSDEIPEKISGGLGTTFTEMHANLAIPILEDRLSLILSGRNTTNFLLETPTLTSYRTKVFQETKVGEADEEDETSQTLQFYDWNAKLIYQLNDRISFKASLFQSRNQFNYDSFLIEDVFESSDNVNNMVNALNLSMDINWNSQLTSKVSLLRSYYENDYAFLLNTIEEERTLESLNSYNDIIDRSLVWTNTWSTSPKNQLQFGYELNEKQVTLNQEEQFLFEENNSSNIQVSGVFHNLFGSYGYLAEKWQINVGLRSTYYVEQGTFDLSPRLNFQQILNESLKWKVSAGILHQYISQLKEFGSTELGVNNQVWVLNETESGLTQRAFKLSTGFLLQKNKWLIDMEVYYNQINGLSTLSPLLNLNNVDIEISNGNSFAYGLDLLLKKQWGPYHFWLNYSLGNVQYEFPEVLEAKFPANHDQRHNLSIINSLRTNNWNFSLSYQYRSGLPFSLPNGILDIYNEEEEEFFYEIEFAEINGERLSGYHRLDLGLTYQWEINEGTNLELAFSLINVLNKRNALSRDYFLGGDDDEPLDESDLFLVDKFLLRRTPQLLIRYSW